MQLADLGRICENRIAIQDFACQAASFDTVDFMVSIVLVENGKLTSRPLQGRAQRGDMLDGRLDVALDDNGDAVLKNVANAVGIDAKDLISEICLRITESLAERDEFRREVYGQITAAVLAIDVVDGLPVATWDFAFPGGHIVCAFPMISISENPMVAGEVERSVQWILRTKERFASALPRLYRAAINEGRRLLATPRGTLH